MAGYSFSVTIGAWIGAALWGFQPAGVIYAFGATMACLPLLVELRHGSRR